MQIQGLWSQTLPSQQSSALSQSPGINSQAAQSSGGTNLGLGPMSLPSGMAKAQS